MSEMFEGARTSKIFPACPDGLNARYWVFLLDPDAKYLRDDGAPDMVGWSQWVHERVREFGIEHPEKMLCEGRVHDQTAFDEWLCRKHPETKESIDRGIERVRESGFIDDIAGYVPKGKASRGMV